MPDFLSFINEILWGSVMIYLLLGAGVWFTWRTKFIQFRYIRQFSRSLKKSLQPQPGGLTSFQALCMSGGARGQRQYGRRGAGHCRRWPRRRFLDVGLGAARHGQQFRRMFSRAAL